MEQNKERDMWVEKLQQALKGGVSLEDRLLKVWDVVAEMKEVRSIKQGSTP